MDERLASKLRGIRLAVFDVDGVFTDGRLYRGPGGFEMKVFHTRDGHGVKALLRAGIEVAVISGRHSEAVSERMAELGVDSVHAGVSDKLPCLRDLLTELELSPDHCAFMGDDVVDLPPMQEVGFAGAPADAHPEVRARAHWLAEAPGGFGAVRQFCDLILAARGEDTGYAGN